MRFSVLSSGSKANCTFIEAGGSSILIDCGLSCKVTEKRLWEVGIRPDQIEGIIVTHEHSDHIQGVSVFSRRYKIPVYANQSTSHHLKSIYALEEFETGNSFWIGAMRISPFSIVHDAVDPVGFSIQAEGLKFTQATDLGRVTALVEEALTDCNAMVLESNHDQEMLLNCDYPWELKQRISSSHGHLSNDTAGALLGQLVHTGLLHVVLAHLSENSNTPELALHTAERYLEAASLQTLICGSVDKATPLLLVDEVREPIRAQG